MANPQAARDVLSNRHEYFRETSDFFHTRRRVFGPRSAQIDIGRAARGLLRHHLEAHRADIPRLVDEALTPASTWPDAGNLLVRELLRTALVHPDSPAALSRAVDAVIERAVLSGAREHHSTLSRAVFRRRTMRSITTEIRERRLAGATTGTTAPRDLLDITVSAGGPTARPAELAEVYLSFLFATVGSIGFALGWSVYLVGTHPGAENAEPGWIVREAMRLWPVAWMFARTPEKEHRLAGVPVAPPDQVDVCTYLVHRHPAYWERPDEFVPERWAQPIRDPAFMPFGHGPHTCAGATVTMSLLEDLVLAVVRHRNLSVELCGEAAPPGPALAPPRFTMRLRHSRDSAEGR
ncbi:cytochrome P450 [Streptomyces beijiangensis]|uniref:cytochrome P450 n=1 Tax=Streptomyces beijiangensis TaxID=163361 RepID=UPI0027DBCA6A|nr:cytochrome P450 [Streptomyces beijiangensis]